MSIFLTLLESCFYLGVSLILVGLVLERSFSYTPDASFGKEDCLFKLRELVVVRSICYTPEAGFSEEFLLHSSKAGFSEEFLDTPRTGFSEEFLLHS